MPQGISLWYSNVPEKKQSSHLRSGERDASLTSQSQPLPETEKINSGSVVSLHQMPSGDTPAGDLLQLDSQKAFEAQRTLRFPFPEANWLACCPWKLSSRVFLLIPNTETSHLFTSANTPDKLTELADMVRKVENKNK